MKKELLLLIVLCISTFGYGQQHFRFRYDLGTLLKDNPSLELQKVDTISKKKVYYTKTSTLETIKGTITRTSLDDLLGVITKTNKITGDRSARDTLYVRLWPITNSDLVSTNESIYDFEDNYTDFIIPLDTITKWQLHKGYRSLDIPFSAVQLFAINIPLRVNLKNREVGSEFINANISVSKIWGKTRVYKSEFVEPRHRYWGLGLFGGLGTTTNSEDQEEVGLFYGGNIIGSVYNVNLIGTIGFESTVSKNGRTAPYIGFGFGFDLFTLTGIGMSDDD